MTDEEIKQYLKENLRLSWDYHNNKYYVVLKIAGEKISELSFGEGY